jgi:hypothetical protein
MADTLARHVAQACAGADLEVEDLWDILDDPDQGGRSGAPPSRTCSPQSCPMAATWPRTTFNVAAGRSARRPGSTSRACGSRRSASTRLGTWSRASPCCCATSSAAASRCACWRGPAPGACAAVVPSRRQGPLGHLGLWPSPLDWRKKWPPLREREAFQDPGSPCSRPGWKLAIRAQANSPQQH